MTFQFFFENSTVSSIESFGKNIPSLFSIEIAVGNFDNVSVWFCGPHAFAQCLFKGLDAYGFDKRSFHYDDFAMR